MPPRPQASAVMFDLDGTLVQTRRASWDVFRTVSDDFGLGLTGPQEYFALFNGNIFASLDALCQGRADSGEVKKAFLDRLRAEYNPAMVPGMVDVIRRLAGYCTLAVVSSNATEVLRRVLVGNGIAYCFSHVFGGDMAPDKAAAIRSFLSDASSQYGRRCEVAYDETPAAARPDLATTVLVTDTAGDVRDALDVGIRAVGVAWGMHTAGELTGAGAEFVAIWPQELPGYLLGDTATAPAGACAVPVPAGPAVAAGPAAPGGGSCGADECHCGCQGRPGRGGRTAEPPSVAARLTAAAAVRRERRRRAARAPRPSVPSGGNVPTPPVPAGGVPPPHRAPLRHPAPAAELRDAVRRILAPAPGR
jgi:phosphoglycolate phosphatase